MHFKIHRGTKEIGGTCVEVWTNRTRILLDFGMPLVDSEGKKFDFRKYRALTVTDLADKGVLPKIKGLYGDADNSIDGVILSHPHQDHYGLTNYIVDDVVYYLGEATHKVIELNNIFTPQKIHLKRTKYFVKERKFTIGDFSITPYWADHSAFDAYSFLIEANGKKLFYSGDFRAHGRKGKAFYWFTHNAPKNVDYLLLEGTTIGRNQKPFKSELSIEQELKELFSQSGKICLIYTSGQNIDRLVSIYKACATKGKTFVVDVYVAKVLYELSRFARIPYPSDRFRNLKVMFPYYTSSRLKKEGHEKILYEFRKYKITKGEISDLYDEIVMLVRPSMQTDLQHIKGIEGGNLVYSMWEGYLETPNTKKFIDYLVNRSFKIHKIHTSGHADTKTLKKMVVALSPKNIVPIHTFKSGEYKDIFTLPIVELDDGEVRKV